VSQDERRGPHRSGPVCRHEVFAGLAAESAFFVLNVSSVAAICLGFIYLRWNDLGNGDFQYYGYGGVDFLLHPKLYDRIYIDKPPLAFLMYLPMALLPGIVRVPIYFAIVIAAEVFLLHTLLRQLGFNEAACLGGTVFFLAATLFKPQLDYVSLSHLTNLLILGACIAAVRGSTRGVFISGILIAASFYIRQNNVMLALYPIILGKFTEFKPLAVYAISMLSGFLALLGLFCLISDVYLFVYVTFVYPFTYANIGIGGPPFIFRQTVWRFAQGLREALLLFVMLWCITAWVRGRPAVSGRQMVLLFAVAFIVIVAPNKQFDHYQGYLLIWFGILGAWTVYIFTLPFLRQSQGWLFWGAAGCVIVLVAAAAQKEMKLNVELASARTQLSDVLPEIRKALNSRPGNPTLQVFDAVYTLHEAYDGLLLTLTGATPATPLIFTLLFSEEAAAALPARFRDQWGLLAQKPPDIVILKNVGDTTEVGPNFARSLHQFLESHGYRERTLTNRVTIAERL